MILSYYCKILTYRTSTVKPNISKKNMRHSLKMDNIFSAKYSTPAAGVPHHHPTARYYCFCDAGHACPPSFCPRYHIRMHIPAGVYCHK